MRKILATIPLAALFVVSAGILGGPATAVSASTTVDYTLPS